MLEGFDVLKCFDFIDNVKVEIEFGILGGNKFWLGKDYLNLIIRDFFDVYRLYEGMLYLKVVFSDC